MMRRLIFAPASDGPARVSAPEAEMLFRLKDATLGQENSTEWKKLFVQAIANHLIAHQSYTPALAAEEIRLKAPFEARPFSRIPSDPRQELVDSTGLHDSVPVPDQDQHIAEVNGDVEADHEISESETDWLNRLHRADRQRDEFERALIDFLAEDRVRPF